MENPDYRKMSAGEFAQAVGMDARKWAEAAVQFGFCTDEEWAVGWFANAIMAGYDAAHGGGPLNGDHAAFLLGEKDDTMIRHLTSDVFSTPKPTP